MACSSGDRHTHLRVCRFPGPCVGGSNPSRPASLFHRKAQSFVEILPLGPPALLHLNCTLRREDLLRRSRGEGSIYRRKDGLWVTRYKAAGRRKYLYRKTRKAVADKLRGGCAGERSVPI